MILEEGDIRSCSMGAQGEDIILSPKAEQVLHVGFECKNQERFKALLEAFKQVKNNSKGFPVVALKANHLDPVAVVDLDLFINMLHMLHFYNQDWDKLV